MSAKAKKTETKKAREARLRKAREARAARKLAATPVVAPVETVAAVVKQAYKPPVRTHITNQYEHDGLKTVGSELGRPALVWNDVAQIVEDGRVKTVAELVAAFPTIGTTVAARIGRMCNMGYWSIAGHPGVKTGQTKKSNTAFGVNVIENSPNAVIEIKKTFPRKNTL